MFQPGTKAPMEVPNVDIGTAWTAVAALKAATTVARTVAQQLSGGGGAAGSWSGTAAEQYQVRRAALARSVDELALMCGAAATAVSSWADVAGPAVWQLKQTVAEGRAAQERQERQQAAGVYDDPSTEAAIEASWDRYDRVGLRYLAACRELGDRLSSLRDQAPDRPWDLRDNVSGFVDTMIQDAVVEPAYMAWGLTGDGFVNPSRWWSNLTTTIFDLETGGIPHFLQDPEGNAWALANGELKLDAWRKRHFGEGAAAAGALFIRRDPLLGAPFKQKLVLFEHNMAPTRAPMPSRLRLGELFQDIDLLAMEHHRLGHTDRRHTTIDRILYQQDRLVFGTLTDFGARGSRPPLVSSWNDRETANLWVSEALHANKQDVVDWARSGSTASLPIRTRSRVPIGEVMTRDGSGFRIADGRTTIVWLEHRYNGLYVSSAHVGR